MDLYTADNNDFQVVWQCIEFAASDLSSFLSPKKIKNYFLIKFILDWQEKVTEIKLCGINYHIKRPLPSFTVLKITGFR